MESFVLTVRHMIEYKVFRPIDFKTGRDLLEWRQSDPLSYRYRTQPCTYLEDIVLGVGRGISSIAIKVFVYLGTNLIHNNYTIVNYKESAVLCNCTTETFRNAVTVLEQEGMVKQLQALDNRSTRLVAVSPAAYWNGSFGLRDTYIKSWYLTNRRDFNVS